ncbi:MAG TPA: hydantoinase B/oxoprolinase family protein [Thermoanaerobaculia bacterium]|nr:hydantoinase B/oxoprolinase family protein [Thermoanaerobaculia bacterium]
MTSSPRPEAVQLELFTHRFEAVARQMGERLQRTAVSTNVKERLDFSCALLDAAGELVVNAPHIPVHLGALGLCVRLVARALPLGPHDVVVTNHPGYGGSHLPDVTVVTPVFGDPEDPSDQASGEAAVLPPRVPLLGFVASRAHHAEIGGVRPGSMPPGARCLAEEGVVIPPTYLLRAGASRWEEVRRLLLEAPYPTRAVEENLADLRAAVAANHRGAEALRDLAREHGRPAIAHFMAALKRHAEDRLRAALARLPPGRYEAVERLDDGSPLAVRIEIRGQDSAAAGGGLAPKISPGAAAAVIDFTGSAPVHPGNLNAPPAVVRSAVLYVLRLLVAEPLPLNEGLLRPIEIRVPRGLLDPPFPADSWQAPAVVGGNVETSQRLVDTLLKALGLVACSQGTMNNVLFGNDRVSFYETVCGGSGAGPGFAGASAVHTHMTNTRITDPEILEHRYPVRLERFAIRTGSGGTGRYPGGDGAIRELTFLEPVALSLLTQHRVEAPYGLAGGGPGQRGRQRLVRASGEVVELKPLDACDALPGDRLILETPGGGGWGPPLPSAGEGD